MNSNNTLPNEIRSKVFKLTPPWLRGWKGLWVLSAGIYLVVYSLWLFLKWTDPRYELLIAGLAYLPLGIFSAICASYAANQKMLNQDTRRAWVFIAFSMVSLSLADIIYTILESTRGIGFPDIPDIFYLLFYPLAFMGLTIIPTRVYDPSQKKTWKIDLAIMIVSATSLLWYFIIAPTAVAGGESWAEILVAGAYPAMDVLLLASVASILFRRSEINTRYSLYLLGAGLLFYIIGDIGYAWQVLQDLYLTGSWVDIFWTLSYFIIGLAALRQTSLHLTETDIGEKTHANWQTSLLPFIALSVSVIVSFYASSTGDGTGIRTNGLILGTAIAVFLTITRQIITMRENSRLVDDLNLASDQLRENAKILEERVVERTGELEGQTRRLQLAAQIARDAASARNIETLLDQVTILILNRFNLYHTGIYLLDQKREYVVLTASPTEAGKQMIANNHKIGIREENIISRVAATGEPRISPSIEPGMLRLRNPLLPNTRSEMALPLKAENRTIGVLDVQSDQPQTFHEEDVAIMQIITDQLAIAIERTRLLQQVEENLRELQQVHGRSTRESWKSLAESGLIGNTGYHFDNMRIQGITVIPKLGAEAMQAGKLVMQGADGNTQSKQALAAIPVKLRGQSIGVVTVKLRENYNPDTIKTIEQAVERLASSLESARLFEEARSRADREQAIAHVTTSISSATELDGILRTTVEEIGKSLGNSEVSIQLLEYLE